MSDYEHLIAIAEHCAGLQCDYIEADRFLLDFPIRGIPTLLFPVFSGRTFLVDLVHIHRDVFGHAREGDSLETTSEREGDSLETTSEPEVEDFSDLADRYFSQLGEVDLPPINIRCPFDPNWSTQQVIENIMDFRDAAMKYSLLFDAYKFTNDPVRIIQARTLASAPDHPLDPFFLDASYIVMYRVHLSVEIASWRRQNALCIS